MSRRVWGCWAVALVAVLVAGACSEPLDESPVATETTVARDDVAQSDTVTESDTVADEADNPLDDNPLNDNPVNETSEPNDEPDTSEPAEPSDGSVVAGQAGEAWFLGEIPDRAVAADSDLEPILIGMINQEDTPLGSFPEVRAAAEAATAFINAELGGVDGRPVELLTCITSFNVEQSQSCAQELVQEGIVAFVGGVDITSNGAYPIIEQNDVPVVGGIPASLVEQKSPNAFFFSGGGAGGAAAFMKHAADSGATKVLLAYGEFDSFEVAARDYAAVVGESLGLEVELLSFSLFVTDYLPILTKAQDVEADALIVLAADAACVPVMQGMAALEIDAQLYLTGACAADSIIDAAGEDIVGVLFNSEGPIEPDDPEGALFDEATQRYAAEPAGGAGTVGFRGMMNLYGILSNIGGDNISSATILEAARRSIDRPSFWGHPYTCDGNQVPGLPALCAPQQVLFEVTTAGGVPSGVGDWIETAELFQVIDG